MDPFRAWRAESVRRWLAAGRGDTVNELIVPQHSHKKFILGNPTVIRMR
jgi:hypothetical protein